jgi:hypothetical protein
VGSVTSTRSDPARFVVKPEPAGRSAVEQRLAEVGDVRALDGGDLLELRVAAGGGNDAAATWEHIVGASGPLEWAAPVLVDDDGADLYPTGELTVRFAAEPTAEQLEQFASEHALRVVRRNEFIASQAVFAPTEPLRTYLPAKVQEVDALPEVSAAWANTSSGYRRA